ncbi:MAG: hypothetical protein N3F09_01420 [Bacteroidia bacterium]|nr:hypothetical protein [Bacteroidia bacterium]
MIGYPKVRKFPVYLKDQKTGNMTAVLSESEWESILVVGKRRIYSRHKAITYADKLYVQDLLTSGMEEIDEQEWLTEKKAADTLQ